MLPRRHAAGADARYVRAVAPPLTGTAGNRRGGGMLIGIVIWALTALLVCPPDFNYYADVGRFQVTNGFLTGPLFLIGALAVSGYLLASRLALSLRVARHVTFGLLALIALATLSTLWSGDPAATVRRLFRLYALLLSALAFAVAGWDSRRFQHVLRPAITLLLVGSLVFGLLAPQLAIEPGAAQDVLGAWKGLTMQKNGLGALAGVGALLWAHAWLAREVRTGYAILGLTASMACLLLSKSSTSLLSVLAAVPFMYLLLRTRPGMRRYMPYIVGVFATLVLVYSLAILDLVPGTSYLLAPITAITGRDMTFSGRIFIWNIMLGAIRLHPVLGIGYGAFWTGPTPDSPSYEFLRALYFYPTEAHNGYLDVINELGFVGGICLLAYLISFLRQSLKLLAIDRTQGALYLGILFQGFMENLSESHWFSVTSFDFLFFTLATMALARHAVELQTARATSEGIHSGPDTPTAATGRNARRLPLRKSRAGRSTA